MAKYNVGFLDKGIVREVVTVHASNKRIAYLKAENIYRSLHWNFSYDDMFCDLRK